MGTASSSQNVGRMTSSTTLQINNSITAINPFLNESNLACVAEEVNREVDRMLTGIDC